MANAIVLRTDFRIPGATTHIHAGRIAHFVRDHKNPLTPDGIHEILPDVIGLNKALSQGRVDEKMQGSRVTPPDHQLVAENAVKHAVQAVGQGREHELLSSS